MDNLFAYFSEWLQAPELLRKRYDAFTSDLLLIPHLDLSKADEVAREAIGRLMSGDFALSIDQKVVASFRYLKRLRSLVPGETEALRQFIDNWYAFLDQTLNIDSHQAGAQDGVPNGSKSSAAAGSHQAELKTLAAFSLIEDYKLPLGQEELDELVAEIARLENKNLNLATATQYVLQEALKRADSGKNARGGLLDKEIWDRIDVLALIIVLMDREGLKPAVADPELQEWVIGYFQKKSKVDLGGGASNEKYILRKAGQKVVVYSSYHHTKQAAAADKDSDSQRLVLAADGPSFKPLADGNPNDPRRLSFVLQLTPTPDSNGKMKPVLQVGPHELRPRHTDRVILRIPNPRSDSGSGGPTRWKTLRVVWEGASDRLESKEPDDNEPGSLHYDSREKKWTFEIVRAARDKKGEVFANLGPDDWPLFPVFQRPAELKGDVLTLHLSSAHELEALASQFHTVLLGGIENLGRTVYSATLTRLLQEALKAQLAALTMRGAALHFELSGEVSGKVLKEFCEFYGKGANRHFSINREQLIQITSEYGSPYFVAPRPIVPEIPFTIYWRAKFLLTRLEMGSIRIHDLELDMLALRQASGEDQANLIVRLEKHRQAMLLSKAAVPVALTVRSGSSPNWAPIFSTQSLVALLDFADEYANFLAPGSRDLRERIFQEVLRKGYSDAAPSDISVVVVPVIFVNFEPNVSLAGAGDMDFATHSVMAR